MVDQVVPRDQHGGRSEQRIIGIELRYVWPDTGAVEEVALVPCDVRLPTTNQSPYMPKGRLTVTFHTSAGDVNLPGQLELLQ